MIRGPRVVMLLGNGFSPDPRVEYEARALVRAGASVQLVGWDRDGDLPEREDLDGIDVHRIRLASTHGRGSSQALLMPKVWKQFIRKAVELRPDVVHAHDLDTLPAGWRAARKTGACLVFDAHESYPDMLGPNVAGPIRAGCRWLERFLVPRTDLLVTVGERLREHYRAMGARDTEVVGNWRDPQPDSNSADKVRQAVRIEAGVEEPSVLICFIANLTHERRLEPLLDAVEADPRVHLVVGGKGPAAAGAAAAAERCSRIRYLGLVDPVDVARWTAAADAVYYGFDPGNPNARFSAPNKLFEALAAGIPVITARFGEIGEIVADSGCGILVEDYTPEHLARAMAQLRDADRLRQLKAAAKRAGTRYTRRAADRALVSAYSRLRTRGDWTLPETVGEAA